MSPYKSLVDILLTGIPIKSWWMVSGRKNGAEFEVAEEWIGARRFAKRGCSKVRGKSSVMDTCLGYPPSFRKRDPYGRGTRIYKGSSTLQIFRGIPIYAYPYTGVSLLVGVLLYRCMLKCDPAWAVPPALTSQWQWYLSLPHVVCGSWLPLITPFLAA